jgi:hypothetical protein
MNFPYLGCMYNIELEQESQDALSRLFEKHSGEISN